MKITLRQAHKLIDKIHGRLATFSISATQSVNIWEIESGQLEFERLNKDFLNMCGRHNTLIHARQCIRNQIQQANVGEVDATIAARKELLDELGFQRHVMSTVNSHAVTSATALERKIEAERESAKVSTATYGRSTDAVQICLLTDRDVEELDRQINLKQLEVEKLEDKLSHLNSSITIELYSDVVKTLQSENLL